MTSSGPPGVAPAPDEAAGSGGRYRARRTPLRERALALLARREHSRRELAAKLTPHAGAPEELEALLDALTARGQLSEERFAEGRARLLSRKYGVARILNDLKSRGVDAGLAQVAVAPVKATELARAREVWRRKFGALPHTHEERARQMRFLQSRGFAFDTLREVLGAADEAGETGSSA